MSWHDAFGRTGDVTWAQECARAALVFVYALVVVRLAGRRTYGKWAALDIVVSVIAGSALSRAVTGSAPLAGTLAAVSLLLALHWLLAHAVARSSRLSHLVEGRVIELGRGGRLDAVAARRHAVSEADLGEALRSKGVEDVGATRRVVLEPSGRISVLERKARED